MAMMQLILGSSSPARAQVLKRTGVSFQVIAPNVDETPLQGESVTAMVCRLAEKKAQAIKPKEAAIIIASDQVALLNGQVLGKPHSHKNAVKQLTMCSNETVVFYTSLTILNTQSQQMTTDFATFSVHFRALTAVEITRYLRLEQPYQCAGSLRFEGFGITLLAKTSGDDPNALLGLPLIKLTSMLKAQGIDLLDFAEQK